jgi:hypothetical protein
MEQTKRSGKISSTNEDDYNDEINPIEDIIDRLNNCRLNYYKLYKKNYKVASIRLRQDLEIIIQTAKQLKRDALAHRKAIEAREDAAKKEAENF